MVNGLSGIYIFFMIVSSSCDLVSSTEHVFAPIKSANKCQTGQSRSYDHTSKQEAENILHLPQGHGEGTDIILFKRLENWSQ